MTNSTDTTFIENVAKVCHEANRSYCETQGDYSGPKWKNAHIWQRDSNMNRVIFHIEHPGSTPADIHANWMKEKKDNGWVYGDTKDPEDKTHPCMVPLNLVKLKKRRS